MESGRASKKKKKKKKTQYDHESSDDETYNEMDEGAGDTGPAVGMANYNQADQDHYVPPRASQVCRSVALVNPPPCHDCHYCTPFYMRDWGNN